MSRKEELDRARWWALLGTLAGFVVWWSLTILGEHLPQRLLPRYVTVAVLALSLLAAAVWAYFLWRTQRLATEIRDDPELERALEDEYTRHVRTRSWTVGFWCLLATQGLLLAAASVWDFSALLAGRIGVLVGVAAPLGTYLVLDRA